MARQNIRLLTSRGKIALSFKLYYKSSDIAINSNIFKIRKTKTISSNTESGIIFIENKCVCKCFIILSRNLNTDNKARDKNSCMGENI